MQIISKYKTIYRWKTGTIHIQVMWIIYGAFNIFHLKIASNSQKSQTSSLVIQLNHPSPYKHPHDRKKIQTQRHKLHFWPNSNIKLKCWGEKKKKKKKQGYRHHHRNRCKSSSWFGCLKMLPCQFFHNLFLETLKLDCWYKFVT